jgi:hypothetical protein
LVTNATELINAGKRDQWKDDIDESVKSYNEWYVRFGPQTYRRIRPGLKTEVKKVFTITNNLMEITPQILRGHPKIVEVLRMCTSPYLAKDRLVGLSSIGRNLIDALEGDKLPPRMPEPRLLEELERVCLVINKFVDSALFPWLKGAGKPGERDLDVALEVVADRLARARADTEIRNEQQREQIKRIREYLVSIGYQELKSSLITAPSALEPGKFVVSLNLKVRNEDGKEINMQTDVVVQPKSASPGSVPKVIEAKSAGDYANPNKRWKEEGTKIQALKQTFGEGMSLTLYLKGYFPETYLEHEAGKGIDWIWDHRVRDLSKLGL